MFVCSREEIATARGATSNDEVLLEKPGRIALVKDELEEYAPRYGDCCSDEFLPRPIQGGPGPPVGTSLGPEKKATGRRRRRRRQKVRPGLPETRGSRTSAESLRLRGSTS